MSIIVKNVKLRLDKNYDIDDITEENFWKRKEPKYVILSINIKNNTMNYTKSRFGLYHIRKVNYIRRFMIWKIQVKKILDTIRPLNIDLSLFKDMSKTPISGVFIFLTFPPIASLSN